MRHFYHRSRRFRNEFSSLLAGDSDHMPKAGFLIERGHCSDEENNEVQRRKKSSNPPLGLSGSSEG